MKFSLIITALALPGLLLVGRERPRSTPGGGPTAAVRKPALPAGEQLAGTVLAALYQLLKTPVRGRVVRTYFSAGQTVPVGAPLLKLAVGAGSSARTVFALAPAAGDLTQARVGDGEYVTAGTPYTRLTSRGPVRVRVAAGAAAGLHPGDSLRVLTGPVGLLGRTTPLASLSPDVSTGTVVLVLGHLG
ncbi:hypothetical protein [Hymenobacter coccineus]|uniref:Uncharacterized protein n=1 Tax=Hymenobacter coccineus TaxID=1908235 RepID=A0A1G1SU03_9BACT|nr:hypothetical protein [Hymenobacter coccineus]OGX82120.1 hypothetical protein BEN49_02930 [Hymenobacter coccineus]